MGKKYFFLSNRRDRETNPELIKVSGANHCPRAPARSIPYSSSYTLCEKEVYKVPFRIEEIKVSQLLTLSVRGPTLDADSELKIHSANRHISVGSYVTYNTFVHFVC